MGHDVAYKQSSSYPGPSRFSPMSSFRVFLVLHSTSRYVIYFELNFFEGCADSFFFFNMWMSSCCSIICWKDQLCSFALPLPSLLKISRPHFSDLFLCSLFCSVDFVFPFLSSHSSLLPYFLFLSFILTAVLKLYN